MLRFVWFFELILIIQTRIKNVEICLFLFNQVVLIFLPRDHPKTVIVSCRPKSEEKMLKVKPMTSATEHSFLIHNVNALI